MKKRKKTINYILLGATLLLLLGLNIISQDHWLDSDMAAEMLSQSDLPVTQVALRVGFGSIATFNRVFRTQKGCTPSQYRNVHLELRK